MTADTPNRSVSIDEAVAREYSAEAPHLPALFELLDAGVPVPFIACYRGDRVGGIPEARIREIRGRRRELARLEARRAEILEGLPVEGGPAEGWREELRRASDVATLEKLHRAFLSTREGDGAELEEKFGALASALLEGGSGLTIGDLAEPLVSEERGIPSADAAVDGAVRVLARRFASDLGIRRRLLTLCSEKGKLKSVLIPDGDSQKKYQTYHDFSQPVNSLPSHRVLAILRGEKEKALAVSVEMERDAALAVLRERISVPEEHPAKEQIARAAEMAWDEILRPAIERELLDDAKAVADEDAVKIFARNLEQLLLMPPAGRKVVMGVEPGIRRGLKIAVVGAEGEYLGHASVYPFPPREKVDAAKKTIGDFCRHHKVEMIGVGSGPGCREVERFLRQTIKEDEGLDLPVALVNEAGIASYSGSARGKAEFPKLDPRVRCSVAIARRLQDPLAELVKLEPSSIGVGPYQRDVDQARLDAALEEVVESCVAKIGVDVNHADAEVLRHVPGIGRERAKALVAWRSENGPIRNLAQLREIPGCGEAAWHFAAGFLRIADGENPLDATAIHPECYEVVESMAGKLGIAPGELLANAAALAGLDPAGFTSDRIGLGTVNSVFEELRSPGRDPRGEFVLPEFREDLNSIEDLKDGMTLEGVVTNIASFGAFVDVGVDQEGLIHVSELSDGFVKDPGSVVSVGQRVKVRVIGIDQDRKRLSLSMRTPGQKKGPRREGDRTRRSRGAGGAPTGTPAGAPTRDGAPARGGAARGRGGDRRGRATGGGGRPERRGRGAGRSGGRSGGRPGRDRDDDRRRDDGDRKPRIVEQKAKRVPEPKIDPDLPEEEVFRLKLERLRKKFEQGS